MSSSPIKLYYWKPNEPGGVNLGDEINPKIVEAVSGRRVVRSGFGDADLFAIGSILTFPLKYPTFTQREMPVHVWGSGTLNPAAIPASAKYAFSSVRGPLTRCITSCPQDLPVGDPGLLVSRLWPGATRPRYRWGIMPHHGQLESRELQSLHENTPDSVLLDPTDPDILGTLEKLSSCERIASTGLHGLIFADAYGIPSVWLRIGELHSGRSWKFFDYFASIGRDNFDPAPISPSLDLNDIGEEFVATRHLGRVAKVQDTIEESFPESLRGGSTVAVRQAQPVVAAASAPRASISIRFLKHDAESWLARHLSDGEFEPPAFSALQLIERQAARAQELGPQPLWEGYGQPEATRTSKQVRTNSSAGRFYHWLVRQRQPGVIVEVGTAFGVSGMFWLSGLQANGHGHLFTFDPNDVWRSIAVGNLSEVGDRFTSVHGTFEDHHQATLPDAPVDLCFIDAIHTSEFVYPQFEMLRNRMRDGGIMVLDDINFSQDMKRCWQDLARRSEVIASLECGSRVGLIEIARR